MPTFRVRIALIVRLVMKFVVNIDFGLAKSTVFTSCMVIQTREYESTRVLNWRDEFHNCLHYVIVQQYKSLDKIFGQL